MKTTFVIQNLKCGGCENTVVTNLSAIPEISKVQVDVANSSVTFNYESASHLNIVEETLSKLGYPVYGDKNSLRKKATSYLSCALGRMK